MVRVRRKDNTAKFMRQLKKATQETLKDAALKLMKISKATVSRKYTGKARRRGQTQETVSQSTNQETKESS